MQNYYPRKSFIPDFRRVIFPVWAVAINAIKLFYFVKFAEFAQSSCESFALLIKMVFLCAVFELFNLFEILYLTAKSHSVEFAVFDSK